MMNVLTSKVVLKHELDEEQLKGMWELFHAYYAFSNEEIFFKDLQEKTHVILFVDHNEALKGFKAIHNYRFRFQNTDVNIVYSGNAIMHPEYWGTQAFALAFAQFMKRTFSENPDLPLYWFLICSGFRTYRSLPLFFTQFYPKFDAPTPPYEKRLMEALARHKFPEEYRDGVIYVKEKRDCLVEELADPKKRKHPHIEHFLKLNPDFRLGNELVCLAEYSENNLSSLAKKAVSMSMENIHTG